jgi:hypothetical protein
MMSAAKGNTRMPDMFRLPPEIGVCPECGAEIDIEVVEWDTETGIPTDAGCFFNCTAEDDAHYRTPYVDWVPLELYIYPWIYDHIRVRDIPDENGNVSTRLMDGRIVHSRVTVERI